MKDYEMTIKYATKALNIEPKLIDVLLFRASSYDKLGNKKLACEDFQTAKSLGVVNLSDEKINNICKEQ
jgi:Tfp pilus assembly protein PilF